MGSLDSMWTISPHLDYDAQGWGFRSHNFAEISSPCPKVIHLSFECPFAVVSSSKEF